MAVLYVVRHAIAEQRDAERWPDDSVRPLTEKGEASFRRAARGLRTIVDGVEVVLSSPYVRAWRTAEILHDDAGWPEPARYDELAAVRAPAEALDVLRAHASVDTVAVVGHEPYLSGLVSILLTRKETAVALDLKKGGAVCLDVVGAGAVLRWVVTPRILRALERER
jgi:phosphohistidine phosphatase